MPAAVAPRSSSNSRCSVCRSLLRCWDDRNHPVRSGLICADVASSAPWWSTIWRLLAFLLSYLRARLCPLAAERLQIVSGSKNYAASCLVVVHYFTAVYRFWVVICDNEYGALIAITWRVRAARQTRLDNRSNSLDIRLLYASSQNLVTYTILRTQIS